MTQSRTRHSKIVSQSNIHLCMAGLRSVKMASKSWLPIPPSSHFSLANIPFGVISTQRNQIPRPGVAIGSHVLDLAAFTTRGGFLRSPELNDLGHVFTQHGTLNPFAALGRPVHRRFREYLQAVFSETSDILRDNPDFQQECLIDTTKEKVKMHLPMKIGDYTDFFAGKHHAFNAGSIFRGPANALQPNYHHLPVGYHGRASSVVVSGTEIRRPLGQIGRPVLSATKKLDVELELGCLLCKGNDMGSPIPISQAEDSIFGYVLLNDWSARDIQAWEYIPLGPFNGKNFATTISPWVVLADALEPFLTSGIENETEIVDYLKENRKENIPDIKLEVDITTPEFDTTTIIQTSSRHLLWSFPQMIAHHTVGGCPMNPGDLLGSGTISGLSENSLGSLLELSQNGQEELFLAGMETRTFLRDGDTITIRGVAGDSEGGLVGFGECVGRIIPALRPDELR